MKVNGVDEGQCLTWLGLNFYTTVPKINYPKKYERRLFKYSKRGFGVCLTTSDWARVDFDAMDDIEWENANVRCNHFFSNSITSLSLIHR